MQKQIHGGDIYSHAGKIIDFSANINPLGLPDGVKAALKASIDDWAHYPDPLCRRLTAAIACAERTVQAHILCGNGAADLIFRLIYACKPRCALLLAPTFAEYEIALREVGCTITRHRLREENEFRLTDEILEEMVPALDLLILCNPNNPTGQPIEAALVERIAQRCSKYGIRLLIDECFMPFVDKPQQYTMLAKLEQYPNIVVLKAFTKLYAMAGLRLGYLLCADRRLVEQTACCGQPWSVSTPAQIAGIAAIGQTQYLQETRRIIKQERAYLMNGLYRLGMRVYGSQANYVFFRCAEDTNLSERLASCGILLRSCANYEGLDAHFYRAAVKMPQENAMLLDALAAVLKEG